MNPAKAVIVAGGAQGIGRAAAVAFADAGYGVTVADIDEAAGAGVARTLEAAGKRAVFAHADLSRAEQVRAAVDRATAEFGRLDVVFNNVGIQPDASYKRIEDLDEALWDQILHVNLKSHFLMAKYAIPHLRAAGGGVIINTASVQGLQSAPLVGAYAATKGAVLSLTRNLALDYASDGIRVLAVCPGAIDTPMLQNAVRLFAREDTRRAMDDLARRHPIGRIGRPEEVASVVVFLASEAASFMTGEFVCVDGGLMAKGAWA